MTRIGDQRRREILTAASSCFARKGFHQTSIADICATAEMSPGSLYRYFRSKEEIIRAMVEEERRESAELLDDLAKVADVPAGVSALFVDVLGTFADPNVNAMHAEITSEALRNPEIASIVREGDGATRLALAELIQRGQANGSLDSSLDASATAEILIALLDGLWWRQAMRPDADPKRHAASLTILVQRFLQPSSSETR